MTSTGMPYKALQLMGGAPDSGVGSIFLQDAMNARMLSVVRLAQALFDDMHTLVAR